MFANELVLIEASPQDM